VLQTAGTVGHEERGVCSRTALSIAAHLNAAGLDNRIFGSAKRALAHAGLDETVKRRLREMYRGLDLVALLEQMREAQTETELGQRAIDRQDGPHRADAHKLGLVVQYRTATLRKVHLDG